MGYEGQESSIKNSVIKNEFLEATNYLEIPKSKQQNLDSITWLNYLLFINTMLYYAQRWIELAFQNKNLNT
jgi:hypothetical protein